MIRSKPGMARGTSLPAEKIHSILILRPHHISIPDVIKAVSAIKDQFPSAEFSFSGNKENLPDPELSALRTSGFISKFILYEYKEMSQFKYIRILRRNRFDAVVLLSSWSDYYQPALSQKAEMLSLLSGTRWVLKYDLGSLELTGFSENNGWVTKFRILAPDLFVLSVGFMFLPLTIIALAVLLYNQLEYFGNKVPSSTVSANIYMWERLRNKEEVKDDLSGGL